MACIAALYDLNVFLINCQSDFFFTDAEDPLSPHRQQTPRLMV
jgi:hypothetical protein